MTNSNQNDKLSTIAVMHSNLNSEKVTKKDVIEQTKVNVKSALKRIAEKLTNDSSLTLDETFLAIFTCLQDKLKSFITAEHFCDMTRAELKSKYHCDETTSNENKSEIHIREKIHSAYNANEFFTFEDDRVYETSLIADFTKKQSEMSHSNLFNITETRVNVSLRTFRKRFIAVKLNSEFFKLFKSNEMNDYYAIIQANLYK